MSKLKRSDLFSRLNGQAYRAVESATLLCKARGNPYVELAHWVNQIILSGETDWREAVRFFGIDEAKLSRDLITALDALPRGASSISDFAAALETAVKEAWITASIQFGENAVRTGHLLIALKTTPELAGIFHRISGEFIKINGDLLAEKFAEITRNSSETSSFQSETPAPPSGRTDQQGEALRLYTVDMTANAAKSDPVAGRDSEIRKIIDILTRRRQNNPILTGDAGVGKTAVVEGFARRLAEGDVPPSLKGAKLYALDMGLLQAGASMKGEFENRLKQVISGIQNADSPAILFIDEAHTLIGAGGAAGQNDAANLLKPPLARGELRCIAATTYQEYIKYFEKDPALARRFQNIIVDEPDDETAVRMLRGLAANLEKHHKVFLTDEAISCAVRLSRRYIPARQLPDKAVSVLDTACARVSSSQNAEPAPLEYSRRRAESLRLEIEILNREDAAGIEHTQKIAELKDDLQNEEAKLNELAGRFEKEKTLAAEINALRQTLQNNENAPEKKAELKQKEAQLIQIQGESPLVSPLVDARPVSAVISEWTGIPLGRMLKDEIKSVLTLGEELNKRVIGQENGIEMIAKRIITARASLGDPNKPIAVFMLAGPSGVGKTETALALAERIYGSEEQIITINMSEFQESHTVSTLKGAPPGYVGYGEGGALTEPVRRKPYSVVLLDEVEKAHPDVHEIFFQVFDKGQMEDGAGRSINFRNTIIILTTNAGDTAIERLCAREGTPPSFKELEDAARPALSKVFPAALMGRLQVIPYLPLQKQSLLRIISAKLDAVGRRVRENYNAVLEISGAVKDEIIRRCDNASSGARLIDAVISNAILPEISAGFLKKALDGGSFSKASIDVRDNEFVYTLE